MPFRALSAGGVDTSDATAGPENIDIGYTAYGASGKLTGARYVHNALVRQITFDSNADYGYSITENSVSASGLIGNCLTCDGAAKYIEILDSKKIINGDKFSISMWIKTSTSPQFLTGVHDPGYANNPRYYFAIDSGYPKFQSKSSDGTDTFVTSTINVCDNAWHHLAVTINKTTNSIVFYVDGVNEDSDTFTTDPGAATINFFVGRNGATSYATGLIDQIRIYEDVLTQADVTTLYNSGSGI